MSAPPDKPGLSAADTDRLLSECAGWQAKYEHEHAESERLRRDLAHATRTLAHETARCQVLEAELTKRADVPVRHW